jgi:hypothetical protein
VTDRQEGTRRLYRIEADGLSQLRAYLDRFWDQALASYKDYAERDQRANRKRRRR